MKPTEPPSATAPASDLPLRPDAARTLAEAASLPVYQHRDEILERLAANRVIVVESPTGSGKTTQLPRILYEAGYAKSGRIGVTQPRRVAAVSVCEFIQHQLRAETDLHPSFAAYKMRFEDTTTVDTRIKVMTDGILLQEVKFDRRLGEYSVLLVDEAHERSLNIDFVLGLLRDVLANRSEFKVIVSSATINAEIFSAFFDDCPIVHIDTPVHPIDVHYRPLATEDDPEELQSSIEKTVVEIDAARTPGDILIFLSGEREIRECLTRLDALPQSRRWQLLPLYGRVPQAEQQRVFDDAGQKRKIVVATNIAETSITIPRVAFVIDRAQRTLQMVDCSDPKRPKGLFTYAPGGKGRVYEVVPNGDFLYVYGHFPNVEFKEKGLPWAMCSSL